MVAERKALLLISVVVTLVLLSSVYFLGSDARQAQDSTLKAREAVLNETCRDGSPDKKTTKKACDDREALLLQLKTHGWCWGAPNEYEYQKDWQRCDAASNIAVAKSPGGDLVSAPDQEVNSAPNASDVVQYNEQNALYGEQLRIQVADVSSCIRTYQRAMLARGERVHKNLVDGPLERCAGGIVPFMEGTLGRPPKEVGAFLIALSNEQLNGILGK